MDYKGLDFSNIEINDDLIISIFFTKKDKMKPNTKWILGLPNFNKILLYLQSRYNFDSEFNYKDALYGIKFKLSEIPRCPECGKQLHYLGRRERRGFGKICPDYYCRTRHSRKLAKIKYLELYGVDHNWKVPKIRETCKRTYKSKTGYENPAQNPEVQTKMWKSQKKNNSFRKSKIEDSSYVWLCEEYGVENIKRQYNKDSRYPWHCDFYIKSLDLFIEINGMWTHGPHPFDENNPEDLKLLEKWKAKVKTSKFYEKAIDGWTIRDILKRKTAKENNLKYIEIFSGDFTKEFLLKTIKDCINHENK